MTIKELKSIIKSLPDDVEVKMQINGGFVLPVCSAYCDVDVDSQYNEILGKKALFICQ